MQAYARVAIDSPVGALDREFDYSVPERMAGRVQVGSVVRVVLHGRNVRAFVLELLDTPAVPKVRALSSLVSEEPIFTRDTIEVARWVARRYVVPLGVVLHDAVPGRFSTPAAPRASQVPRAARPGWFKQDVRSAVNDARQLCVVTPAMSSEVALIVHAVGEAATLGKRSLVICPRVEVADAIAAEIPSAAVVHGEERPADRAAAWAAARDGRTDVVIGGRSALLVPLDELGLVVVASCHDRSLKSERAPRLHGLVVSRQRAIASGAAFLATSAAPPLGLRIDGIDWIQSMRGPVRPETARPRKGPVTPRLVELIGSTLAKGQGVFVFAGRRGGTLRLRCVDCGWSPSCPACGTGLALAGDSLACRVCGATAGVPDACTGCGGRLSERGWGHERIAKELEKAVDARVVPVAAGQDAPDLDVPVVFVGTIAALRAGRRFGAVCVADLDQLLRRPDFRAAEYALQTLHELADVVEDGGRFLVQTREPEHHVVQSFARGSYEYFADRELSFREETGYPPFGMVVRVDLAAADLDALRQELEPSGARVVGALERRGRLSALVRAADIEPLLDGLRRFSRAHPRTKIDVDPVDVT